MNKFLNKIYSKEWLNNALITLEFRGKPYLYYTEYNTYAELKKVVKIVELCENYTKERRLKPNEISILDVGCGAGNVSLPLGSIGYNVIGLDSDKESIIKANKRAKRKNINNCNFVVKNALEYLHNVKDEFHIIIAADILEHLKEPRYLCDGILKSLVIGGIFIVTIPNGYGVSELFMTIPAQIFRKVFGIKMKAGYDHVQRFTLQRIRKLLVGCGFQQVKFITSLDFLSPFPFLNRSILARLDLKISEGIPKSIANRWMFVGIKGIKNELRK